MSLRCVGVAVAVRLVAGQSVSASVSAPPTPPPSPTPTPSLWPNATDGWWSVNGMDCTGQGLIAVATAYTNLSSCLNFCLAYGPTCGGAVWDLARQCWLKKVVGGYAYSVNAARWCNMYRPRLSAAVIAAYMFALAAAR